MNGECNNLKFKLGYFPGGPEAKALRSQCRGLGSSPGQGTCAPNAGGLGSSPGQGTCAPSAGGLGSSPGQGTRSYKLRLRIHMQRLKIPCAETKTKSSKINKIN